MLSSPAIEPAKTTVEVFFRKVRRVNWDCEAKGESNGVIEGVFTTRESILDLVRQYLTRKPRQSVFFVAGQADSRRGFSSELVAPKLQFQGRKFQAEALRRRSKLTTALEEESEFGVQALACPIRQFAARLNKLKPELRTRKARSRESLGIFVHSRHERVLVSLGSASADTIENLKLPAFLIAP